MNATTRHDPSFRAPDYVRSIAPYVPGKPVEELARELDLDPATIVKLASNENPRGPSAAVRAAIDAAVGELSRYPDGNGFALKTALAARHGVAADGIVLGNGSNDILELVTQAFLRPGDSAVYSQHAFAVYPLATMARGAAGIEVPARDLGHDLAAMRAAITAATRVVFVANPNNPTGTWIDAAALEGFIAVGSRGRRRRARRGLQRVPRAGAVRAVAPPGSRRYPNLIVSRTFSKAYGLAALRIGYGLMHPAGRRHAQPRPAAVQRQCAGAGGRARGAGRRQLRRREPRAQPRGPARAGGRGPRRWAGPSCRRTPISCWSRSATRRRSTPSLLRQGVIVRPGRQLRAAAHLRVTVGLPAENRRFLDALAVALS